MVDKQFCIAMYHYFNQVCTREVTPSLQAIEKIFTPEITFKINDTLLTKNSHEMVEHMNVAIKPYKKVWFQPNDLIILADPYIITSHYFHIINQDDSKERTMAINIFTVKGQRISDWTAVVGYANTEDKQIDDANFVHSMLSKE